jgi:predicted nucleic acid-binding protein
MTNKPAYIVIDTNLLISAGLLPRSKSAQVLALAVEHFVIAQNEATWAELVSRIEKDKFDRYFGEPGRLHHLSRLAQVMQTFPQEASVQISRNADDDKPNIEEP